MILTVCPNPSIDCTIELDSLNVGHLNRIDSKVETYSGKALNVAIGVARLGEECLATGFMFENHRRMFEHTLEKEGVLHDFILNPGSARVNYKIIDKRSMLTEINDRGEQISREKQLELLETIKEKSIGAEIVVISGSLPKGVEHSFYGEMVASVWDGAKIIIDTEKENMIEALKKRRVFMVKPNIHELEDFSNMIVHSNKDIVLAAQSYVEAGAQNVLVSMGAEGAVLTDGKESFFCKSASVAVNSTVGAGDSMVSATCVGLSLGVPPTEILRRAVAAGTAAVTTSGTNLFYKDKYNEIYTKIKTERI